MGFTLIRNDENIIIPIVICDKCGKIIKNQKLGLALWNEEVVGEITDLEFLHKSCNIRYDKKSMVLGEYLRQLLKYGLKEEKVE